jgi:hypothetical protein
VHLIFSTPSSTRLLRPRISSALVSLTPSCLLRPRVSALSFTPPSTPCLIYCVSSSTVHHRLRPSLASFIPLPLLSSSQLRAAARVYVY